MPSFNLAMYYTHTNQSTTDDTLNIYFYPKHCKFEKKGIDETRHNITTSMHALQAKLASLTWPKTYMCTHAKNHLSCAWYEEGWYPLASFFTHAILKEALTAGDGSIDRVMHPLISHNDLARRPRGRPAGACSKTSNYKMRKYSTIRR